MGTSEPRRKRLPVLAGPGSGYKARETDDRPKRVWGDPKGGEDLLAYPRYVLDVPWVVPWGMYERRMEDVNGERYHKQRNPVRSVTVVQWPTVSSGETDVLHPQDAGMPGSRDLGRLGSRPGNVLPLVGLPQRTYTGTNSADKTDRPLPG